MPIFRHVAAVCYRQQELSNLLHEKRYHEALSLALTMEKPFHSLTIIRRKFLLGCLISKISSVSAEVDKKKL